MSFAAGETSKSDLARLMVGRDVVFTLDKKHRDPGEIVLEIDGLNAILEVVKEGLGYAVLPSYTLSNFNTPKDFSVHEIEKPQLLSQLMLVWSARRPLTPTHKESLRLAKDMVSTVITSAAR